MKHLVAFGKRFMAAVRDHPSGLDLVLLAVVAIHFLATLFGYVPNIWAGLASATDQASVRAVYLAMLGPAAIVAGFAGVVVVFGLQSSSNRFREFRVAAGKALKRTWIASTLSGFVAVLLCVGAALSSVAGAPQIAPWFFELAILILAHGALRLVWILQGLIGIVQADDVQQVDANNVFPVDQLPYNSQRRAG